MSGYASTLGWIDSNNNETNSFNSGFSLNTGSENEIPVWNSTGLNLKQTGTYINTENDTISITDNPNQNIGSYVTQVGAGINTDSNFITAVGVNSGGYNDVSSYNTSVGAYSSYNCIGSINSVVVGHGSGRTGSTINRAILNSFVGGTEAGGFSGALRDCTVLGTSTLRNANDDHEAANCIGIDAARDMVGSINNSDIVGHRALEDYSGAITNSQIFGDSVANGVSGSINSSTVIGHRALVNSNNLTVNTSILMGFQAAYNRDNSTLSGVLGIGDRVLMNGTTNLSNSVAIGTLSCTNLGGSSNVAVGFSSLNNSGNCEYQTAVGTYAGFSGTGDFNSYVGGICGHNVSGNFNTLVGYNIRDPPTVINNSITIRAGGTGLNDPFTPESDTLLIGTQDSNILLRADLGSGAKNAEPGNDNEVSWGTSSKRWSDIYSYGLNVSGIANTQNIIPSTSDTYDIGSTTSYFNSAVIQNYYIAERTTDFTTSNSNFNAIYTNNGILKYSTDTTVSTVNVIQQISSDTVRFSAGIANESTDFTLVADKYSNGLVHLYSTSQISWESGTITAGSTSITLEYTTGFLYSADSEIQPPHITGHRFSVQTTDSFNRYMIYFSNRSSIALHPIDEISSGEYFQFDVWYTL